MRIKLPTNIAIAIIVIVIALGLAVAGSGDLSKFRNLANDYYVYYLTDYKKSLKDLGQRYNLKIKYRVGPDLIDEKGRLPPINGKATQLDEFGIARFVKILPEVLSQYPPEVIKTHIESIRLAKELWFYGVRYGGSMFEKILYLTNSGREQGFTDFFIKQTFHHEFSSVLMKSHDFPTEKWISANPPDVKYETDFEKYLQSIEQDRDLKGNEYFYQRGMISKYGYSTVENDFNLYAQTVFNEPKRMKDLVNKYPIIRKKYEILKDFYLSISPEFSKTFDPIA
jgi:hypothetical protein